MAAAASSQITPIAASASSRIPKSATQTDWSLRPYGKVGEEHVGAVPGELAVEPAAS